MSDPQEPLWRPSCSLDVLRERGAFLHQIRGFFAQRGVLEVDTPVLSAYTTPEVQIESFVSQFQGPGSAQGKTLYLHTSPEFCMKRLLAAGSGPIYQITKVFRQGEWGKVHNPEFSLLEWYQPGYSAEPMMAEIRALLTAVLHTPAAEVITYRALFQRDMKLDPLAISLEELHTQAQNQGVDSRCCHHKDELLELIMATCLQPRLGWDRPCIVIDFPLSQATYAKAVVGSEVAVAERFECFVNGIELGNGYVEISQAEELAARMAQENHKRLEKGQRQIPLDPYLLAALSQGDAGGTGMALGLDRLLMVKLGKSSLAEVLSFDFGRV